MKRDFEISLEYNKTDIINKMLCLIYDVKIVNFSDEKVSKEQVLSEIKKEISKADEKFIILKSYNNKKAIFSFDIDKWFDTKNKILDTENRYVKKILLSKIPTMILNNVNAVDYTRVIEESFRNYINKNKEIKNKITNSVAENLPLVYYRFKYEGVQNSIRIEVKEQFRHNILAVLRSKKSPKKQLKKMDFDSSVETYLKFTRKKKK
jgi:hypothetical protein